MANGRRDGLDRTSGAVHNGRRGAERKPTTLGLGFEALRVVMCSVQGDEPSLPPPFLLTLGRVGTMDSQAIFASILHASERAGLLGQGLNDPHALYHATEDALEGVMRNPAGLAPTLRTASIQFAVVRGPRFEGVEHERDWIAVAMFGTVGAPRYSWEHEAVGLGVHNL